MAAPLVVFPDAEQVVCVALTDADLGVPVVVEVPNPRPARFVKVLRTGGDRRDLVTDNPLITIETWAATKEAAADLAQLARAHVFAMRGTRPGDLTTVYRIADAGGPVSLPDPATGSPRYTFTCSIAMRGAQPPEVP